MFIDIDTIAPGTDFTTELERALVGTTVVLVIIGRRWLTAADAQGRRRLDVSDDFVRREILTALQRGARLIPVLVQNTTMPTAADLPDTLAHWRAARRSRSNTKSSAPTHSVSPTQSRLCSNGVAQDRD